ncbi:MAG: UPF0182 family protein [Chloroflexi bacterium]|nr:UPF0182 family protein [Chloroflexota bacterium]
MDPVVPTERWPRRQGRGNSPIGNGRIAVVGFVVVLLVLATVGVDLYTDWLWFGSVGYAPVYQTVLTNQVGLFVAAAGFFLLLYLPSAFLARRLARGFEHLSPPDEDVLWAYIARVGSRFSGEMSVYGRIVQIGIVVLGLLLSVVMGSVASGQWPILLRFLNQVPFGVADPVFGRDVSFFVFTLPFLRSAHSWLLGTFVLVATTTFAVYAVVSAYELGVNLERVMFNLPRSVKLHIALLAAVLMLLVGANHLLDVYELVYSTRGVTYGASYADVRAEMPALYIMAAVAASAAVLIVVSAFARSLRPALTGLAAWALVAVLGGLVFPNMVENFEVKPNQLEKERPYVENGIAMTRRAFGLDRIQESFYPYEEAVTADDVRNNPETIRNIRLWDHRPLRETLNQIQSIRSYYTFADVDVDRYAVDSGYRQVMVAARELDRTRLPSQAQTWVNQRLKFTHGYGVTMALVAAVAEEGRPQLLLQDVPPRGAFQITRPEVYFGSRPSDYVLIRTTEPEFDFPRGDENAETRHAGGAGIKMGNWLARAAFALRFRDGNLMLSGAVREDSELLWRRSVRERVERIAPFLLQDTDPYIVVADGQLYWMLDTYTHTSAYPYSQPVYWQPLGPRTIGNWLNYVRNSVKVVINAYDGSIAFYVADPSDPLIQTYQRVFPTLFRPMSEMPASLQQHVRYPVDLFRLQADRYLTFHMQDPTVFYNREDSWDIAREKVGWDVNPAPVEPYYVVMRLPGEAHEEFLLMQPFTPVNKTNMIAWLAARSDGANYGKLVVYKYPKERLVFGPAQVEGRIDQDPTISSQFTLWSQAGSRVIRGNLLVIPLGASNLYVEPIYLQADNGPIPELKRVIVSTGNRVVMEPTLEEALGKLFIGAQGLAPSMGAGPVAQPPAQSAGQSAAGPSAPPTGEMTALIQSANLHYTRAQEALRAGDWGRYGEEQRALEADLRRLADLTR